MNKRTSPFAYNILRLAQHRKCNTKGGSSWPAAQDIGEFGRPKIVRVPTTESDLPQQIISGFWAFTITRGADMLQRTLCVPIARTRACSLIAKLISAEIGEQYIVKYAVGEKCGFRNVLQKEGVGGDMSACIMQTSV